MELGEHSGWQAGRLRVFSVGVNSLAKFLKTSTAQNRVTVYFVRLMDEIPTIDFLLPDEIARAERYVTPELSQRFLCCRAALRVILAKRLSVSPGEVQFKLGRWGKPELKNSSSSPVHFNVSHSGDLGVIAVGARPLGIDLEIPARKFSASAIASQLLAPDERRTWEALPADQQDAEILKLWVCKESLLKAMGLGIAHGLPEISFELPLETTQPFRPKRIGGNLQLHIEEDASCSRNQWLDPTAWKLHWLDTAPEAFTALSAHASVDEIQSQFYDLKSLG